MKIGFRLFASLWLLTGLGMFFSSAQAMTPEETLAQIEGNLHLELVERTNENVTDHLIGLGAMKKVRGQWGLKKSDRYSGELTRITWRVIDGFSASEVLADIEQAFGLLSDTEQTDDVGAESDSELLFGCDGRACGHGAQWASRIFGERLLYGRGDAQQYRAYSLLNQQYRLVVYASVRSSDRQYVRVELLKLNPSLMNIEGS
ncbi:MAG: DUF4892 domain-containing protein [Halioglobus sp.]